MILPVLEPGPRRSPYIAVGTEIGSYRIEAYLDRGGMASVYEATDLRLTRKVALKVLTEELLLTFSWVNFESPRVCRRLRLLGKMGSCREDLGATRRSCGTVLFGWWRRSGRSMLRSGRP